MSTDKSLIKPKKERKDTEIRRQVGKMIKKFREEKHFSQELLASKIDKSVDAISAIERGLNFPSDETIEAISEVLEKPIFEFYRLDVEKYLDPKKTGYINSIIAMLYHLEEKDLRIIEGQIRVIREIKD